MPARHKRVRAWAVEADGTELLLRTLDPLAHWYLRRRRVRRDTSDVARLRAVGDEGLLILSATQVVDPILGVAHRDLDLGFALGKQAGLERLLHGFLGALRISATLG